MEELLIEKTHVNVSKEWIEGLIHAAEQSEKELKGADFLRAYSKVAHLFGYIQSAKSLK